MSIEAPIKTTSEGLLLHFDAANNKSYRGSGNAWNNLTGNGNSTLENTPTFSSDANGSVVLDGTDDYVDVTNSISSTTLSPAIATFSIWFKPSDSVLNSRGSSLISRGNYNTAGGFFIHLYTNTVSNNAPGVAASFSYSTTTSYTHNATNQFTLNGFNKWHNVVVAADNQLSLYINGLHKQTVSRNVSTIIYGNGAINTGGDTNLRICSTLSYAPTGSDPNWAPYKGSVSIVQMWNRRLSPTEILQNYDSTKSRFGL
jgi:hypothetical protein